MIFEIIGSRLLSPYLGASTYIWTSLIGVILASLSLGYWLGGKMADRKPDVKILAAVIFLAGGAVSLTILLKDILLSAISGLPAMLEIKSLIAAVLLFAPASVLLGFVTPYAVKLKMSSLDTSARTVGRLYALSTVGSILGTFLAGFFLLPFVGSTRTLYVIGAVLIGLSFLLIPFSISRFKIGVLTLLILAIGATEARDFYLLQINDLHDIDTEYSRYRIFTNTDPATSKKIRVMMNDPYFVQSGMYLESDEMAFEYPKYYHLIRLFKSDFRKVLMIGGAGYSFPKEYLRTYPNARMDVVEIDPQVTQIARKFFRLQDDPRLRIIHQDGRVFLNQAEDKIYDAILMDAFGSLFSVPWQLTTIEAVRHIHRVLKDDGVVIFNLGSAIRGRGSRFLQAEYKTYQQIFPSVYLFKVNLDHSDERLQNLMIVACKTEFKSLENDAYITELLSHQYTQPFPLELSLLTDDRAPVEYYSSFAQNIYIPK